MFSFVSTNSNSFGIMSNSLILVLRIGYGSLIQEFEELVGSDNSYSQCQLLFGRIVLCVLKLGNFYAVWN